MAEKEVTHTIQVSQRQRELVVRGLAMLESSLRRQINQKGINPAISEILTNEVGEVNIVRMKF